MQKTNGKPEFAEDATAIDADALRQFCSQVLQKLGVSAADAHLTADNLVFANLRGTDTHGVSRLGIYAQLIEGGVVKAVPELKILKDQGATILVDGDDALGQVSGHFAMKHAIDKGKKNGVSFVGIRNGGHLGALAYYSMMALPHNMIGICTTNTPSVLAPWGGKEPVLGNNPIAIAAPTGKKMPLVLDMALSVVARGNLFLAQRAGKKIPEGWAIDKNGVPTRDPEMALEGSVLPIGAYKGSGISIMTDVLCGVLMGSAFGRDTGSVIPPDLSKHLGLGHLMMAVAIENFMPVDDFLSRITRLMEQVQSSPLADGFDEILVPNQKEYRIQKKRTKEGIPISPTTLAELHRLGDRLNVPSLF